MDMKIQNTGPKSLSDIQILQAFPQARQIVQAKIREWGAERETVVMVIKASLDLSRGYDDVTREVWTEWVKLFYGPKLDAIDRHHWRLRNLKAVLRGVSPDPDRITPAMIELAQAVPIEGIAGLEVRRAGRLYRGLCPFHEERSPSFTIYPNGGGFFCFGCGAGGDAIEFLRLKHGRTFPEAVKFLARGAAE